MYLEQEKGEEDPMQIPRPLPTNKIPEVMAPGACLLDPPLSTTGVCSPAV